MQNTKVTDSSALSIVHVHRPAWVNGENEEPHCGLLAASELNELKPQRVVHAVQTPEPKASPCDVVAAGSSHKMYASAGRDLQE